MHFNSNYQLQNHLKVTMHDNNTTLIVDTIQNELKLIFELSKQFKSKPNLPSTLLIAS
jgi:hypothetical protein